MRWLFALFILIPALEVWGLITVGHIIGGWQTFLLVVAIAFAGAYLAKREGRRVWEQARLQLSRGEVPSGIVLDGVCIFAGGLLMMMPGFFSDIVGLLLVAPPTRLPIKLWLGTYLRRKLERGELGFTRFR